MHFRCNNVTISIYSEASMKVIFTTCEGIAYQNMNIDIAVKIVVDCSCGDPLFRPTKLHAF